MPAVGFNIQTPFVRAKLTVLKTMVRSLELAQ